MQPQKYLWTILVETFIRHFFLCGAIKIQIIILQCSLDICGTCGTRKKISIFDRKKRQP